MENSENSAPKPGKKTFKEKLKKAFATRHIIGIIAGGIGGFMYFHFTGCTDGACSLRSSPVYFIFLGVAMGYLIADLFKKKKQS